MASRSLGTLTVDLIAKFGGFKEGFSQAERIAAQKSKAIQSQINGLASGIGKAFGIASAVAGSALVVIAKSAIDAADRLTELSEQTGISVEELSRLGYVAKLSGTDLESLNGSLTKFSKNINEAAAGSKSQAEAFAAIGVSVKDAEGNIKSVDQLLIEVADRFAGYEDGASKAALAQEFFGKSGADLIPLLNQGADGIQRLKDESDALGATISTNTAQAAAQFNDNLDKLTTVAQGVANQFAAALLPALSEFTSDAVAGAKEANNFESELQGLAVVLELLAGAANIALTPLRVLLVQIGALADVGSAVANGDFGRLPEIIGKAHAKQWDIVTGLFEDGANDVVASSENAVASTTSMLDRAGIEWSKTAKQLITAQKQVVGAGTVLANGPGVGSVLANPAPRQRTAAPIIMSGGGGSSSGGGQSKAVKDAESLTRQYETLTAQLREQIALFDDRTNAARVAYDLENSELQKLTQAQKDALLAQAKALDELQQRQEGEDFLSQQAEKLDALRERFQLEEELQAQSYAKQLAELEAFKAQGLLTEEEYAELSTQVEREKVEQMAALQQQRLADASNLFGSLGQIATAFAGEQSALAQGIFAVQKAFSIAQSIVAIQTGIAQAAAIPFPANLAAMASVAAATASIVSTIQGTNLSFDGGGYTGMGARAGGLDGKGGFMAMLHPNETVIDHTRGQRMGGATVIQNIQTSDATSFMYSQRQISRRAKRGLATS